MALKFLDLSVQYSKIKLEIDDAIERVIRDCAFISGPYASKFEEEFARYIGVPHCVGCGNGTDALELAITALDLPVASEIIVPANSFIATSEAVTSTGHRVVFCDCDSSDYTLNLDDLSRRISDKTKAVIPVHLYGQSCDMPRIVSLAREYGLKVIEDCAQAHGAESHGIRVGGLGDIATFSFYPGKNLGAYGDAGAITTRSEVMARRVRMIANHGRIAKYDHLFEGRNSRLDGLQAAILSVKLKYLDSWIEIRRAIAARYRVLLQGVGDLVLPADRTWSRHVYHLFVVRTQYRDSLKQFLGSRGIETGIHYPIALPKLSAYSSIGQADEKLFANVADAQLLSLPIGDHMTLSHVDMVVEACVKFFHEA